MPNQPKTPMRSVRVDDEVWLPAKAEAAERGETMTDVIVRALREYALERTKDPARSPK